MLRKLRIILAVTMLAGITLLLAGFGRQWLGWMAKLQFLPSCLALNFLAIAGICLLTFIFGRLYCSVICPFGVMQDILIWLRRQGGLIINRINVRRGKQKQQKLKPLVKHFSYSPERKLPRYIVLGLTIVAMICSIQLFIALIEPYSAYGRVVRSIAGITDGSGWKGAALPVTITGLATLVLISVCAWFWGRLWCNAACPVGTVLGLISRFSIFRIRIDKSKCNDCGRCERGCKSACIDYKTGTIDYSRCIDCFDCIRRCKENAVSFAPALPSAKATDEKDTADNGRRRFLGTVALLVGGTAVARAQSDLAPVTPKTEADRKTRLVPPGATGEKEFYSKCTGCQLCVASCPNGVLRPSTDLGHLLQPVMGYENGYCRPECTACSEVCPTGAIKKVLKGQKQTISIGSAIVDVNLCIAAKKGRGCGNCAYHCPTGAIKMGPAGGKKWRPVVNEEMCIGCGACEFLCPVRPVSAITVNGRSTHKIS